MQSYRALLVALTLSLCACKQAPPTGEHRPTQATPRPNAPTLPPKPATPAQEKLAASTATQPSPPKVGINGLDAGRDCKTADSPCSRSESLRASLENADASWRHLIPEGDYEQAARELLDKVDCLALRGGNDIDPSQYGERAHSSIALISSERESFDFALVREALNRKMPLLGLCLGAQEVNVVLQGDLVQDIPSELDNEIDHRQDHPVRAVPDTLFSEIYGDSVMVHSNHHQSVDNMGDGLRVSATASDGVIEAFEAADRNKYPFLIGVQFHPEMALGSAHDRLFRAFTNACRTYAQQRDSTPPPQP